MSGAPLSPSVERPEDPDDARIMLGVLQAVEAGEVRSQRHLAAELGIALGLANAYVKRCIRKGLLKVSEVPARRYAYYLTPQGFATSEDFFVYLRDTFDVLYRDGLEGRPRMMSIGLHNRIAGRPGRIVAVERFMDHLARFDRVWTTTRLEVARHWHAHMPPPTR